MSKKPKCIYIEENLWVGSKPNEKTVKYHNDTYIKKWIEKNKWVSSEGMIIAINVREFLQYLNKL